jgi:O-antigen biosynthesis protein
MGTEAGFPTALCIAGMHRSGTSLVTSLLQSGGLDIGQRLVGAGRGNVKGHFEDLDFSELHLEILKSLRLPSTGFILQRELPFRPKHVHRARALVAERRRRGVPWGWKGPRTTLFLDFWQQLLPEANFLILYRCPWDVIDSLFRRGDKVFRSDPGFAVRVWTHYNRLLLDFHDRFPQRCLCMSSYRVVQSPALLLDALRGKFGLNLGPAANLYDDSLLHRLDSSRWASLVQHHFPEAVELYEQLNERAGQTLVQGVSLADEPPPFLPAEDWAFQDWLDLRVLEEQREELRRQLEKSETELARAGNELAQARAHQDLLREELGQARRQLQLAQAELEHTQSHLHVVLEQVANMETSKFWKLRKGWMTAKYYLRRVG